MTHVNRFSVSDQKFPWPDAHCPDKLIVIPAKTGTHASAAPRFSSSSKAYQRTLGSVRLDHGPRPAPG
jgi:hypothetical protein